MKSKNLSSSAPKSATAINIYTHPDCLLHDTRPHVEQPDRLRSVLACLQKEIPDVQVIESEPASRTDIERVHGSGYIDWLDSISPDKGQVLIDGGDTVMSPKSLAAAYLAAGAVVQATKDVVAGKINRAFCAVRPPGHHAEPDQAMGFCFFNNIAIAAKVALDELGLKKVGIVDFDVHHGNGTQTVAQADTRLLFISSHEKISFPGTGPASDHEIYKNIFNFPLPAGTDSQTIRQVYIDKVFPALEDFNPELIFISAGFDGHRLDPLAHWDLETEDYAWMTEEIVKLAEKCAGGRIISTLEGGYHLDALAESVTAHVKALK